MGIGYGSVFQEQKSIWRLLLALSAKLAKYQLLCVLTIEDNDTFPVNETFFFPKEK